MAAEEFLGTRMAVGQKQTCNFLGIDKLGHPLVLSILEAQAWCSLSERPIAGSPRLIIAAEQDSERKSERDNPPSKTLDWEKTPRLAIL